MKEFEKLWENNHPVYDTGSDTIGYYNIAKEYWKEALEWIKNNRERVGDDYEYMFFDDIKKELDEK